MSNFLSWNCIVLVCLTDIIHRRSKCQGSPGPGPGNNFKKKLIFFFFFFFFYSYLFIINKYENWPKISVSVWIINTNFFLYKLSYLNLVVEIIDLLRLGRVPRLLTYGEGSHNTRGKNDSSGNPIVETRVHLSYFTYFFHSYRVVCV